MLATLEERCILGLGLGEGIGPQLVEGGPAMTLGDSLTCSSA